MHTRIQPPLLLFVGKLTLPTRLSGIDGGISDSEPDYDFENDGWDD